ncbi:MAG: hypothetical protein K6E51_11210 [Treponema sp.]|nr:hypothetical protein [Treponema sp.]
MKKFQFLLFTMFFSLCTGCTMSRSYSFYNAIYREDVNLVKELLEEGSDPDKCRGEAGWVDGNPLKIVSESFENTFYSGKTDDFKDIQLLNLLIDYGADINRLPYVWARVYTWGNKELDSSLTSIYKYHKDEIGERNPEDNFIKDSNRLLKAMLEKGMSPNMKGHPVPYTHRLKLLFFNDRIAFMYFNSSKATTPLYEAIKKGMRWESQVDLLLEYGATLDESCLEAAQQSGDEAMVLKIEKLMKK